MEQNFQANREGILNQVKENYGKLVYSYTTHYKAANILSKTNEAVKWILIILSALTTGGLITIICVDNMRVVEIITAALTTIILALTAYQKSSSLESQIVAHTKTANELWILREEYLSFLTDFNTLSDKDILDKRNILSVRLGDIYSHEPLTNSRAYKKAQKALKSEEEQFFSPQELDLILPRHLRNHLDKKGE